MISDNLKSTKDTNTCLDENVSKYGYSNSIDLSTVKYNFNSNKTVNYG